MADTRQSDPVSAETTLIDVPPEMLETWLEAGGTVLVDVREDFEHTSERIDGSRHAPLGSLDPEALRADCADKRIVFHCVSGTRSTEAATRCATAGGAVFHLLGGIEAWKQSGRPTLKSRSAPRIGVMRQVQMVAGTLVLLGVLLGVLVSPWLLGLSGLVGAGLVFAGASGWCGMAKLLGRAPWNRIPA